MTGRAHHGWMATWSWAVMACALFAASPAGARPGGGHSFHSPGGSHPSFSGGGSHSFHSSRTPSFHYGSSSHSGGGGDDFSPLIPVAIVCGLGLVFAMVVMARDGRRSAWSTKQLEMAAEAFIAADRAAPLGAAARAASTAIAAPVEPHPIRRQLAQLDPDGSLVLFEDFAYALYAAVHRARGWTTDFDVSPYVTGAAAALIARRRTSEIRDVVLGAMRYASLDRQRRGDEEWLVLGLALEGNYSEDGKRMASRERWRLVRRAAAKSRTPTRARIDQCANCGAPFTRLQGNVCQHCHTTLTPGVFDWAVEDIALEREPIDVTVGGYAPEEGTELPTVASPGVAERSIALAAEDAALSFAAINARIATIFAALQDGWSSRDWAKVRPYVSDALFQAQLYWIQEYRRQGRINRTDGARITGTALADVLADQHYVAATVRIWATGLDYTTDEIGAVVGGSTDRERSYSEYWTLIRARGAVANARGDGECPNCGAPVNVNMAGDCGHCHAKITTGSFDWVLSRIEQDEVYGS